MLPLITVLCLVLCQPGCGSKGRKTSLDPQVENALFTASGYSTLTGKWERKTDFAYDEKLILVIDNPYPGRKLRLTLTGGNNKVYEFPTAIETVPDTYQPLTWDTAEGARECVGSDYIMAEVTDAETGELVGLCTFTVKDRDKKNN